MRAPIGRQCAPKACGGALFWTWMCKAGTRMVGAGTCCPDLGRFVPKSGQLLRHIVRGSTGCYHVDALWPFHGFHARRYARTCFRIVFRRRFGTCRGRYEAGAMLLQACLVFLLGSLPFPVVRLLPDPLRIFPLCLGRFSLANDGLRLVAPWTTCASSCASSLFPCAVEGANCPYALPRVGAGLTLPG